MKINVIFFNQPIGEFALSVMSVNDILDISNINRRTFDYNKLQSTGGPQREASNKRISEIAEYSETPDATFPTPILLSIPEDAYKIAGNELEIIKSGKVASVVDGQHRLMGLEKSRSKNNFSLPVVFILNSTEEQKALIFAIINGKQTKVSASIIYDLFDVVEGRSPTKTAHEIARSLNADPNSPFYLRLKMLGKKSDLGNESLSQGTFVTQLLKLISNNVDEDFRLSRSKKPPILRPACIFNRYYYENKDEIILKILLNTFNAVKKVFPFDWENPDKSILSKTTGYTGIMKSMPFLVETGIKEKSLNEEYFIHIFQKLKDYFEISNIMFTKEHFSPSSSGEGKLSDIIKEISQKP